MARTRKVYIKKGKMTIQQILGMIAKSTDNGFPTPYGIVREFINDKGIRKLVENGLIVNVEYYLGDAYDITEAGRQEFS